MNSKMELLAPAGDWQALKAAILNGADAVYFGLSDFNARKRAANFSAEELAAVISYLHDHNAKGYVAFNTLIFPSELGSARGYVLKIAESGADAIIVQDIGIARLLSRMVPSLPVHASTQMTLTDANSLAFAGRLGIRRAIMARELSLAELGGIAADAKMEMEVFAHGALCMSYSGQCLASHFLAQRSANRGMCAQLCRMPYDLLLAGRPVEQHGRIYPLSPLDLATYERIPELAAAGVHCLKIEGRLKNEYYVAAVVAIYREAIDAAARGEKFQLSPNQKATLARSFSRGFSPGFLDGKNHRRLVEGMVPKGRGILVGTVDAVTKSAVAVKVAAGFAELNFGLKAGDRVVFENAGTNGSEQGGRLYKVSVQHARPDILYLTFGRGELDFNAIHPGTAVFKTDDPAVRAMIEQTFSKDRVPNPAPIIATVRAAAGEPLRLCFVDDRSNAVSVESEQVLESARSRPATIELLREQLGRLGSTPFTLADIKIERLDGVMLPKSMLNDLRRKAIAELLEIRRAKSRHRIAEPDALETMRLEIKGAEPKENQAGLSVLVRSAGQFEAILARPGQVTDIYCDFENPELLNEAGQIIKAAGLKFVPATLRIIKPADKGMLERIAAMKPDAVLVRNLAALEFFYRDAPGTKLIADFSLNIANELSVSVLRDFGVVRVTPSHDVAMNELRLMIDRTAPGWYEPIVHGRMELFHTEHCIFANTLPAGGQEHACSRACKNAIELRDCKGLLLPVTRDTACRNTVLSPVISSANNIAEYRRMGLVRFRINLFDETPEQIAQILAKFETDNQATVAATC